MATLSVRHILESLLRKSPPSGSERLSVMPRRAWEGTRTGGALRAGRQPVRQRPLPAMSWSYPMSTRVGLAVVKGKHREAHHRYRESRDGVATMGSGATTDTGRYAATGRDGFAEFASSAHGAG